MKNENFQEQDSTKRSEKSKKYLRCFPRPFDIAVSVFIITRDSPIWRNLVEI